MREMSQRTKIAFLIGIMCLGFLLRLVGLYWGQAYHYAAMGDEMLAYRVAIDLDAGQERALYIGQPNFKTGKLPGPMWALFWLVGLKIGSSPETVCLMMIVLQTCVIYFVYRLAENIFGPEYSLWAAVFFATSPWPVALFRHRLESHPHGVFRGVVVPGALERGDAAELAKHFLGLSAAGHHATISHGGGVYRAGGDAPAVVESVAIESRWLGRRSSWLRYCFTFRMSSAK